MDLVLSFRRQLPLVTWVTWPASLPGSQPAINSLISTDEAALCCSGSSKLHWFFPGLWLTLATLSFSPSVPLKCGALSPQLG